MPVFYATSRYSRRAPTFSKSARKFSRKKRRFRTNKRQKIYRATQPYSIVRKLKAVGNFSLDAAAGAMACNVFYLNSAYDTFGTAGTVQPLGFDQYEALYNRYCVIGYKIEVQAVSTDNTNPIVVGFTPTTSSASLTDVARYKELPATVQKVMTPDIDHTVLYHKGGVKKWLFPRGGKMLTDDTVASAVTTDPSRKVYGHLYVQSLAGADPASVYCYVTITQTIVFFDPKTPSRSTQ